MGKLSLSRARAVVQSPDFPRVFSSLSAIAVRCSPVYIPLHIRFSSSGTLRLRSAAGYDFLAANPVVSCWHITPLIFKEESICR